jgi:hypothetical protein
MKGVKMKHLGAMLAAALVLAACGKSGSVEGNIYEGNGGVVKIEFQSGGKAFASMGPVTQPCSYAQDGKTVTLTCQSDKTVLKVSDDGSLEGPPDGMLAHLTKKKA